MASSRKNMLTVNARQTLMNIARIADQIDGVQLDLQAVRRQSPPNTYLMELSTAERELVAAYNALKQAYINVRTIARKAGETVI